MGRLLDLLCRAARVPQKAELSPWRPGSPMELAVHFLQTAPDLKLEGQASVSCGRKGTQGRPWSAARIRPNGGLLGP